jgi:fibronectin-binding autotransporter adhesin
VAEWGRYTGGVSVSAAERGQYVGVAAHPGRARAAWSLLFAAAGTLAAGLAILFFGHPAAASTTCTITWTGKRGNHQWTAAGNWNKTRVPRATDFVCLPATAGTVSVSTTSSISGVSDADVAAPLEIVAGTLTLSTAGPSSIPQLQTNGGTLTIGAPATLNTVSVNLVAGGVVNHGTLAVKSGVSTSSGTTLENAGTLKVTGSPFVFGGSGTFNNDVGATVLASGSAGAAKATFSQAGGFTNAGTILAANSADVAISLATTGTYQLLQQTATLTAYGGGSLDLVNGSFVYQTGAVMSGAGLHLDDNAVLQGATSTSVLDVTGTLTQGDAALSYAPGASGFAGPGTVKIDTTGTLAIPSGGDFNPCSTTVTCAGAHLVNDGVVNWTGGGYSLFAGGVLENAATFNAQADGQAISGGTGPGEILNDSTGAVIKSGGTAATQLNVPVDNAGTIEALGGADLQLTGSDTLEKTGALTGSGTGSTLELAGGTQTYVTGAQITGTGVQLDGAQLAGAAAANTLNVTGTMTWSAGAPAGPGSLVVTKGATLNVTGNVSMGSATTPGDLVIQGTLAFLNTGGSFTLATPATVENYGTLTLPDGWSATSGGGSPGLITNEAGGDIQKTGGTALSTINVPLTNAGTIRASGSAQLYLEALTNFTPSTAALTGGIYDSEGGALIDLPCGPGNESVTADNATIIVGTGGDVDGCTGTSALESSLNSIGTGSSLTLAGSTTLATVVNPVTNAGAVSVPAGATLKFGSTFAQTGGNTTVNGTLSATGGISVSAGELTGAGTVSSGVTLSGGTLIAAKGPTFTFASITQVHGHLTVPAGTSLSTTGLTQTGGVTKVDGSLTLTTGGINLSGGTVTGSVTVTGGINATGGTVTPESGATLAFTRAVTIGGAALKIPAGTTLTATTGITATSGSIQVNGVLQTGTGQLGLNGATLSGSGIVFGSVSNTAGTVMPGTPGSSPVPGILSVTGTYAQAAGASFDELVAGSGAGSGYGQLAVTGTATLAGTLSVTTAGTFSPTAGQLYHAITASSVSGNWATVAGGFANPGVGYTLEYNPSDFTLLASLATDLAVSVTESSPTPDPTINGSVTYLVSTANNGPNPATSVEVTDTLPSGVTYVSTTPSQGACAESLGEVTCAMGTIPQGATGTVQIVITPVAAGSITNTAVATSALLQSQPSDNTGSNTVAVYAPAFLLSPTAGVGGTTVTINGSGYAPGELATPSFTDAGNVTTAFTAVTVTSGGTFSTTVTIPSGAAPGLGQVTTAASGTGTMQDNFTVQASSADLAVTDTGCTSSCASWSVGQDQSFTVVVTNNGPQSAASVTLSVPVPTDTSWVSTTQSSGPSFSCSEQTGGGGGLETTVCTVSTLASGASAQFTLTYDLQTAPSIGRVTDTAALSSTTNDPDASNNVATGSWTVS